MAGDDPSKSFRMFSRVHLTSQTTVKLLVYSRIKNRQHTRLLDFEGPLYERSAG